MVLTRNTLAGAVGAITGVVRKKFIFTRTNPLTGVLASGLLDGVVTAYRIFNRTLAGVAGALTGVLVKRTNKVLAGALAAGRLTGSVVKRAGKKLAGTAGSLTGVVRKKFIFTRTNPLTGVLASGRLDGVVTTAKKLYRSVAGTLGAVSGVLVRRTNKVLSGVLAPVGVVKRFITKSFSGTVSATGEVTTPWLRRIFRGLVGTATSPKAADGITTLPEATMVPVQAPPNIAATLPTVTKKSG
jgi:hypothetical protein